MARSLIFLILLCLKTPKLAQPLLHSKPEIFSLSSHTLNSSLKNQKPHPSLTQNLPNPNLFTAAAMAFNGSSLGSGKRRLSDEVIPAAKRQRAGSSSAPVLGGSTELLGAILGGVVTSTVGGTQIEFDAPKLGEILGVITTGFDTYVREDKTALAPSRLLEIARKLGQKPRLQSPQAIKKKKVICSLCINYCFGLLSKILFQGGKGAIWRMPWTNA